MILYSEIKDRVREANAMCSDAQALVITNRALSVLKNTGLWDPRFGHMDICTSGCEITLPDDVETPYAINVGGHPADFRNKWFEFHLNGPGTECCSDPYYWDDLGYFPTFRSIGAASTLAALPDQDEGLGLTIKVFGYYQGKAVYSDQGKGVPEEGALVPILWGAGYGTQTIEKFDRIDHVLKPVTKGFVQLVAYDPSSSAGTLCGYFRPEETLPRFRRIRVRGGGGPNSTIAGCLCGQSDSSIQTWVRMKYIRRQWSVLDDNSPIFLHHDSAEAIISAVRYTIKKDKDLMDQAKAYMADAIQILKNAEKVTSRQEIRIQMQARNFGGSGMRNFR